MLADSLTKALPHPAIVHDWEEMGLCRPVGPLSGSVKSSLQRLPDHPDIMTSDIYTSETTYSTWLIFPILPHSFPFLLKTSSIHQLTSVSLPVTEVSIVGSLSLLYHCTHYIYS
jgi:hypothetical protein